MSFLPKQKCKISKQNQCQTRRLLLHLALPGSEPRPRRRRVHPGSQRRGTTTPQHSPAAAARPPNLRFHPEETPQLPRRAQFPPSPGAVRQPSPLCSLSYRQSRSQGPDKPLASTSSGVRAQETNSKARTTLRGTTAAFLSQRLPPGNYQILAHAGAPEFIGKG